MTYANLIAGLIYLLVGGDLLVRGAVAAARRARISPAIVAATVVALGTSVPELVVALRAAMSGYPDLVLGNVVGSNSANVLLVAGTTAILYPIEPGPGPLRRDAVLMLLASVMFLALCLFGDIGAGAGAGLLAMLVLIWGVTVRGAVRDYQSAAPVTIEWALGLPSRIPMITLFIVAGAVGLPLGARMVVDSAIEISVRFGLSEAVVGLTIVALSTSLPELATTLVAGFQGRAGVAIGAILGSNVFNALGIMGVAALASPRAIEVPAGFKVFDLPVMMISAAILAIYVMQRRTIGRRMGIVLAVGYVVYIASLFR